MRAEMTMSKFCMVLMAGSFVLAGLLLLHVWPFSRPAVLIPLAWWTMYLVNRWRVSGPVLGLIAETAERAGFDHCIDKIHNFTTLEGLLRRQ
jgi:hypothetical protein